MRVGRATSSIALFLAAFGLASGVAAQSFENDPRVTFQAECPGLYIIKIYEFRFQGLVPGYAMDVVNTSDKRYTIKYDMTYTERGHGPFLGRQKSVLTVEKELVSRPHRPGTYSQVLLARKERSAYQISSIDEINVFECTG